MTPTPVALLMVTLTLGAATSTAAPFAAPRQASGPAVAAASDAPLHEQARRARTATDHATVARQFRMRAEALSQELSVIDAELQKTPRGPRSGLRYKWPALDPLPGASLRQRAMELRRAEAESRRAAAHHTQLAVERGFSAE